MPRQKTKKGRGWHGDSRGHARAGAIGGKKTAKTQDEQFFSQIGRLGGKKSASVRSKNAMKQEEVVKARQAYGGSLADDDYGS